ncbi:hypothetical protein ACP4OV_022788 [Aristida adscensionis]
MDAESRISHNRPGIILQDRLTEPHSVPLEYLRQITNNFSDERLLGEGGFGIVYKGVEQNGDMVAVKKLTLTTPGNQDMQFENEVHHLMKLNHKNIVKLVGYCFETENTLVKYDGKYVYAEKSERLLCLEYMPKGSLRQHLSGMMNLLDLTGKHAIKLYRVFYTVYTIFTRSGMLILLLFTWTSNLQTYYLIKIWCPKLGILVCLGSSGNNKLEHLLKIVMGQGYVSPEYLNRGLITKKLDIFSLGVIIMEIITGSKDYPYDTGTSSEKFIELVINKWRNRLKKVPGYTSTKMYLDCLQIRKCIQIGLACVKLNWEERPTTYQIIAEHGSWGSIPRHAGLVGMPISSPKRWQDHYRQTDVKIDNIVDDPLLMFELQSCFGEG